MTEREALRMMVTMLFASSSNFEEDCEIIRFYTKTKKGRQRLKKRYNEWMKYKEGERSK